MESIERDRGCVVLEPTPIAIADTKAALDLDSLDDDDVEDMWTMIAE
jgi:hypothetical protein